MLLSRAWPCRLSRRKDHGSSEHHHASCAVPHAAATKVKAVNRPETVWPDTCRHCASVSFSTVTGGSCCHLSNNVTVKTPTRKEVWSGKLTQTKSGLTPEQKVSLYLLLEGIEDRINGGRTGDLCPLVVQSIVQLSPRDS